MVDNLNTGAKDTEFCVICDGPVRVRVGMFKQAYVKDIDKTFTVWFHRACYNEGVELEINKALMEVVREGRGSQK